jgi:hypothetical protein
MIESHKKHFVRYLKECHTQISAKHLIVTLESEKEFWKTDLKAYLSSSDDYEYMKSLIDRISEVNEQIKIIKKEKEL